MEQGSVWFILHQALLNGQPINGSTQTEMQNLLLQEVMAVKAHKTKVEHCFTRLKDYIHDTKSQLDMMLANVEKVITAVQEHTLDMLSSVSFPLVSVEDTEKTIQFAISLSKDKYNISEGAMLLGLSRQTLARYVKNGKYGIQEMITRKRVEISKEDLIRVYRHLNN